MSCFELAVHFFSFILFLPPPCSTFIYRVIINYLIKKSRERKTGRRCSHFLPSLNVPVWKFKRVIFLSWRLKRTSSRSYVLWLLQNVTGGFHYIYDVMTDQPLPLRGDASSLPTSQRESSTSALLSSQKPLNGRRSKTCFAQASTSQKSANSVCVVLDVAGEPGRLQRLEPEDGAGPGQRHLGGSPVSQQSAEEASPGKTHRDLEDVPPQV